ncbi:alpha/beta hydrolase [Bosea sp. BH3]|uniref:alpha/beta hydrolase n=1 Tax=Bosea sp. BH3 TaxID=2871701 RepID=UPI0021CB75FC|nr:prolyl oligopeptidase family serine peptidase [Bosea sp. BH3]MCU4178509.1 prolyl oligopeptidase family serine peptidase [Bosea sp. BH3]
MSARLSRREWLAAAVLCSAPGRGTAGTPSKGTTSVTYAALTPESTLGELLSHPAFKGFGRRLLPWDDRDVDEQARLSDIGALLPYHTNIDLPSTVAALNRLVADAAAGHQVFYELYDDAERKAEPDKAHAGLFFFRGTPGAPFAIVAPGGGFAYVGSVHEGFPYAAEISRAGLNAFVLKYRAGRGGQIATQDLAAAIGFVFRNAGNLAVDTKGYSLWGSSAGARMAAFIGSHGAARFGGPDLPRPAVVVTAYTAHSDVGESEPPTFAVVGSRDGIAPPASMERRVDALRRLGTEVDYRVYPGVGHGFGLGIGTSAEGWIREAIQFWRRQPR